MLDCICSLEMGALVSKNCELGTFFCLLFCEAGLTANEDGKRGCSDSELCHWLRASDFKVIS